MKGSLGGLLQQAQKMQEQMQRAQEELKNLEVTGESGGGMVRVTLTGKHVVRRVQIDPSLGDDIEMLEDLVTAAMNDAVNRVAEATEERMGSLTAGLPLPPGFKMPF